MKTQRIVVVGNGMVGHKFIDSVIAANDESAQIITFSEESRLAYDRVQLTSYFDDDKGAEYLALTDETYYQNHGVNYVLNDKVVSIDTD